MLGSEWLWRKTLPGQDTAELTHQLTALQTRLALDPARRPKYERMISALVSELANRGVDPASLSPATADPEVALGEVIATFSRNLDQQQARFEGRIHSDADERSVRLAALVESTSELYESFFPPMAAAFKDERRGALVDKLTIEYMPLLMLDPDELPRVFAMYVIWQFGYESMADRAVDIDSLRGAFQRGLSRLPDETRESTIASKHKFEWGKLI